MRSIRSHIDAELIEGHSLALPESTATHLLRVLRLGLGDEVLLFNGDGYDYRAQIGRAHV